MSFQRLSAEFSGLHNVIRQSRVRKIHPALLNLATESVGGTGYLKLGHCAGEVFYGCSGFVLLSLAAVREKLME